MIKVSTLKGYGKVEMSVRRIREGEGWELIRAQGGIFDASTADLVDELSDYTDRECVDQHIFESGDVLLIPQAQGWLIGKVR